MKVVATVSFQAVSQQKVLRAAIPDEELENLFQSICPFFFFFLSLMCNPWPKVP